MVHRSLTLLCLLCVLCGAGVSCANIGSPDGGLYDEDPPRITHTSPAYGATNASPKKITLEFNENIKLESAAERVIVSPPQFEMPEIESNGKRVTVTLLDTLKPDFTYTIDFGSSIVDNNEGNPMGEYAFTFSTGERIDTLQVSGYVLEAENLEPIKGILVGLYRLPAAGNDSVVASTPSPAGNDSVVADSLSPVGNDSVVADSLSTDTTFRTIPLERIGRTDGSGHFIVKGIAPGRYRIFALNDQDQTYTYTQRSEKLAFTDRIITPYAKWETRMDTVWHDSIHYDSIFPVQYTHYYPDDIVLTAFTSAGQDRYLLKNERPELHKFSLYFTAPSDTLPRITPLNFTLTDSACVVEASQKNDTLTYWLTDSLTYNLDTLQIRLDYYATDTLGQLALRTDTLEMTSKVTKERLAKLRQQAQEDWEKEYKKQKKAERKAKQAEEEEAERRAEEEERKAAEAEGRKYEKKKKEKKKKDRDEEEELVIPPMPVPPLELKMSNASGLAPDKNVDISFDEPVLQLDTAKVHFTMKVDTLFLPAPYLIQPIEGKVNAYRLYAEWEPDSTYQLELDSAAFVSIYGKANEASKRNIRVKGLDAFSTLFVTLQQADTSAVVELLNGQDKVVSTRTAPTGKADFYFITPQTYYLRMFYDLNGNGVWDTGNYDQRLQPEPVFYYPHELQLKAQWEVSQTWNPTAKPLSRQKPEKITKQKADKKKQIQNRNAEKLAELARRKKK